MKTLEQTIVRGSRYPDDLIELTGLDLLTSHAHVHGLYCFDTLPDVARLKQTLSAALDRHPTFASTTVVRGQRTFFCRNNNGVRFAVFRSDQALDGEPPATLSLESCTWADKDPHTSRHPDPPSTTSFRIILFTNNRWILAVRNVHSLGDGTAFSQLLRCWAHLYQGRLPPPGGTYPRRHVAALRSQGGQKPSSRFAILPTPNFSILHRRRTNQAKAGTVLVHLPMQELRALLHFGREQAQGMLTSSDLLHALVWKAFGLASDLADDEDSQLYSVFDLRRIAELGIPETYIGNAVIERRATLPFAALRTLPLTDIALHFRQSTKPLQARDIRRDIAFLQREYETGRIDERGTFTHFVRSSMVDCLLGTGLYVNDLRFLPSMDLVFEDRARWFETVPTLGFNTAFIYRHTKMEVSIRAVGMMNWLHRFSGHLRKFLQYAL